jgi:hypothetical protein
LPRCELRFLDGSVELIRDGLSPLTWESLGTMAGGEAIDANVSRPGTWQNFEMLV